jgi:hypothetical protein
MLAALPVIFTVGAASAQSVEPSLEDWRRAVSCAAHLEKMADENQRGLDSFISAHRGRAEMKAQLEQLRREQDQGIAVKRGLQSTVERNADAMLAKHHGRWSVQAALPSPAELREREYKQARARMAKVRNIGELTASLNALKCETFLLAPPSGF